MQHRRLYIPQPELFLCVGDPFLPNFPTRDILNALMLGPLACMNHNSGTSQHCYCANSLKTVFLTLGSLYVLRALAKGTAEKHLKECSTSVTVEHWYAVIVKNRLESSFSLPRTIQLWAIMGWTPAILAFCKPEFWNLCCWRIY